MKLLHNYFIETHIIHVFLSKTRRALADKINYDLYVSYEAAL